MVSKGQSAKGHWTLNFVRFGSSFGFFLGFFCLVMHTTQILISTQSNQQICRKAGGGVGLLHATYASSYLSFLIPNSLLAGTYQMHTNILKHLATLSPAMAPKC